MPYLKLEALQTPKACLRVRAGMSPTLFPLFALFFFFFLFFFAFFSSFFHFLGRRWECRNKGSSFLQPTFKMTSFNLCRKRRRLFFFLIFFKYNSKRHCLGLPKSKTTSFWISCHLPKTTLFWTLAIQNDVVLGYLQNLKKTYDG